MYSKGGAEILEGLRGGPIFFWGFYIRGRSFGSERGAEFFGMGKRSVKGESGKNDD